MSPSILAELEKGSTLSADDALRLFREADVLELGRAARRESSRRHGNGATFLIDRNINYTNVCENRCRFCAFFREETDADAFLLDKQAIIARVREAVDLGATQIMLQGGLHPTFDLDFFLDLLTDIKSEFPVALHCFSPPEISYFADKAGLTVEKTLQSLVESGLTSLPGGGAEILDDRVRHEVSPRKIGSEKWLKVMETAHGLGIPTTATMMFGVGESLPERISHLEKIRNLQERTGGFFSFIPWTFQPLNTDIGNGGASTLDYLRMLAISRLFLNNIENVQGSWVTQGPEIGQLSLHFGANDLGSIMLEENVVRAAGVSFRISRDEMVDLIHGAGRNCSQRDTFFHTIRNFDDV